MSRPASRMRVADRVADVLADAGLRDVFMVTGGGAMYLNDAFGRHKRMKVTCFHHEQAAAIAAESYARFSSAPAIVNVTAGPGATNTVTGVACAYLDSLPMVVLAGQMRRSTLVRSTGLPLRQFGDQEIDSVSIVRSITKYAAAVDDPLTVRAHVQRAIRLATTGRPGPVWLELPVDVQAAEVDTEDEAPYDPRQDDETQRGTSNVANSADTIVRLIEASTRPVLYLGSGIRIAGVQREIVELVRRLGVPVVTALNGHDLLDSRTPQLVGRPGMLGDRSGNFAVQNADLVVVLGTRLPIRQVGYNWESWAPHAHVAMVDIDSAELVKPSLHVETPIHADLAEVVPALISRVGSAYEPSVDHTQWLRWCRERRERYPVVLPQYRETVKPINPYAALEIVFRELPEGAIVATGNSWAGTGPGQIPILRAGQRVICNSGTGTMGYDLPAAIGAAISNPDRHIICVAGEGSLQMNIQELQTLAHHKYPVTLLVLNNGGYHSIRATQHRYFPGGDIGFDADTGISFPDLGKIADAYGISFRRVDDLRALPNTLHALYAQAAPTMCEIIVDPTQQIAPKAASRRLSDGTIVSAPLEDLAPFLDRDELAESLLPEPAQPLAAAPVIQKMRIPS